MTHKLLIQESPLVVLPSLAKLIGLNEAILIQQIQYWLHINEKSERYFIEGYYWTPQTHGDWLEAFPFWSESTVRRTIKSLKKFKLIHIENLNTNKWDRTGYYRIDYDVLSQLSDDYEACVQNEQMQVLESTDASVQNEQIEGSQNEHMSSVQNEHIEYSQNEHIFNKTIKETILETKKETGKISITDLPGGEPFKPSSQKKEIKSFDKSLKDLLGDDFTRPQIQVSMDLLQKHPFDLLTQLFLNAIKLETEKPYIFIWLDTIKGKQTALTHTWQNLKYSARQKKKITREPAGVPFKGLSTDEALELIALEKKRKAA